MSGSETPHTTLRVASLRVLPGGTPDDPRAYYSFAVENDDARAPADGFNGVLSYVALDGDMELFALGDTLTLIFGPPPSPVGSGSPGGRRGAEPGPSGGEGGGREDRGQRSPARPPDRESGRPQPAAREGGSRRGG